MKKILAILVAVAALTGLAAAHSSPEEVQQFYGDLLIEGEPAEPGSTVTVRSDDSVVGAITTFQEGRYGEEGGYGKKLAVQDAQNDLDFYVNGIIAEPGIEFNPGEVESQSLNLEVPGDGDVQVRKTFTTSSDEPRIEIPENAERSTGSVQSVKFDDSNLDEGTEIDATVTVSDEPVELADGVSENLQVNVDHSLGEDNNGGSIFFTIDDVDEPESVIVLKEKSEGFERVETEVLNDDEPYRFRADAESYSTFVAAQDLEDPDAEIEADDSRSVDTDETLEFDASSSSDNVEIESYEWEFGDGEDGSGKVVEHEYDDGGDYTVELTVTDPSGNTDTREIDVSVDSNTGGGSDDTDEIATSGDDEETQQDDQDEQTDDTQEEPDDTQNDQGQNQQNNNEEQESEDQSQTDQNEETDNPATGDATGNTPTGGFINSTSGIAAGLLVLILVAVAGLEYTGRTDLTGKVSELLRQSEEELEEEWTGFE